VARDLGALLDQKLSMKPNISKVTGTCFYQLRRLKQVRRIHGPEITATLVTAFVLSRLDNCNAVFACWSSKVDSRSAAAGPKRSSQT
jgi:hypothetical protein